jgi:prephenate dehydrogenase
VAGRVAVIGTGLIGGSIGLALGERDYEVVGWDRDELRRIRARELGAIGVVAASIDDAVAGADLVIVAVPVGAIAVTVVAALDAGAAVVTDVGSVKAPVVTEVEKLRPDESARFVGGHPMAGSEQDGIDGADASLFVGSTWVLTPSANTDERSYTIALRVIRDLGGDLVTLTPEHHDELVALVSHVPQLAASTLMDVASATEEDRPTLMRLAAGGFRDMTRIAAGHPGIWPDILATNRDAVLGALDVYVAALLAAREIVASVADKLVEMRVPVPDRPGVLAEVTTLAGRLGVNVVDVEIAHSLEGGRGVLVLVVAAIDADAYERGLIDLGYHVSRTDLT